MRQRYRIPGENETAYPPVPDMIAPVHPGCASAVQAAGVLSCHGKAL